ncbi:uncharacterized protein LOC111332406 isoform X4 [Stylophora pistillata]|uniref:uncharacterized protein LOC111332406 isoform X4 n=1 Tax=Stylophora pistillata TaxID=50429 RepID=UPI000C04839F|nr:uncharacterized protein LOC111332406 isoform X4 [Stylophora pistillata]
MEVEEKNTKTEASGGPHLLVGYDKLLYMSKLQGIHSEDECENQDIHTKGTHLQTEHLITMKREVIEILSSCEGNCLKLSQFKSRYNRHFGRKFNEFYMLSGKVEEFTNLMAQLDIIEFDQKGSRPVMKLKEPNASQFMLSMGLNVAGSEHSRATDVGRRETLRPRFVKKRERMGSRFQCQNTSADAIDQLTRLKKDIVDMLRSCEGNCLYLSQLQEQYGKTFRQGFFSSHRELLRGKSLAQFLQELDIVELEEGEKGAKRYLMKLKEPHASQFMLNMGFDNAEKPNSFAKKNPEGAENQEGPKSQNTEIDSGHFSEKLTTLKKDIVHLLKSCKGNCLYLSELHDKYWQTFRRGFHRTFKVLFKGKALSQFLSELDDIELEHTGEKGEKKFLMKLKEPHASLPMQRMSLDAAEELDSSSTFEYQQDEFDFKVPTKSHTPATLAGNLAVAASPSIDRVFAVPLAPLDKNVLDPVVQSPAPTSTFQASPPLVLSPSLMQDPSPVTNTHEELDIVDLEETGEEDAKKYLMKVKEPHTSQVNLSTGLNVGGELTYNAEERCQPKEPDSYVLPESHRPLTEGKKAAVVSSPDFGCSHFVAPASDLLDEITVDVREKSLSPLGPTTTALATSPLHMLPPSSSSVSVATNIGFDPTTTANKTPAKAVLSNIEIMEQEVQGKQPLPTGGPPQGIPVFHPPLDQKCPQIQGICLDADEDLTKLKRDIIEILRSCEGNCLYLDKFKTTYRNRFGKTFDKCYPWAKHKKVLRALMPGLDIIDLEQLKLATKGRTKWIMKLKEPHASQFVMRMSLRTTEELSPRGYEAGHQLEEFDSKVPTESYESLTGGKNSAAVLSPDAGRVLLVPSPSQLSDRSSSSPQLNTEACSIDGKVEPPSPLPGVNQAGQRDLPSDFHYDPLAGLKKEIVEILSSCEGHWLNIAQFGRKYKERFGRRFKGPHGKKLKALMYQLDDIILVEEPSYGLFIMKLKVTSLHNQASSIDLGQTRPLDSHGDTRLQQNELLSLQLSESPTEGEKSAVAAGVTNAMTLPPTSAGKELEVKLPTDVEVKSVLLPSEKARIREVGTPGPFENSICNAHNVMNTITSSEKSAVGTVSSHKVNKGAEEIITSLSEEDRFVGLEEVKARLCRDFEKSSLSDLGFKSDKDIPALKNLIEMQAKVNLFVHAYVTFNSITTLYELNQSLADLGSKSDFEQLRLGPLLKQPVVYHMFKAPQNLTAIPQVTTVQIIKYLNKYMSKTTGPLHLEKFLEYLCEQYKCNTPYELGVRIQSLGLAVAVIKKAKQLKTKRLGVIREEISIEMEEEIQRHLRKIKKDLLGQELGDLRSCVMKFLDKSPTDILKAVFECCLEMFDENRQGKVMTFLTMLTKHALGRRLFQLALCVSCKPLLGEAVEALVNNRINTEVASRKANHEETRIRPVPPSEGAVLREVKEWIKCAEHADPTTLARIEANVVNKFPGFTGFEEFGYGSFLKFLTKHKELMEATEEVGGMPQSGRKGARLGYQVSLNSVLDFISQCGTQTSIESIERELCSYYDVNKVTDLGFGSCSCLLEKAVERRVKTITTVYEAALLRHGCGAFDEDSTRFNSGCALGYKSKQEALEAIQSTPLLDDVSLWTHWDDVFGGEVSELGDLKSFLENEGILWGAGKSLSEGHSSVVVMETNPGVLLRVTTHTSAETFRECVFRGDVIGAAGHLVSIVIVNGGVANTPVALLANYVHFSLASMGADDEGDCDQRPTFVLECLNRMPLRLARVIGTKVFLEPFKKLVGSARAASVLLSSCSTQSQRNRLHKLGIACGISQWIEDFQNRVSPDKGNIEGFLSSEHCNDESRGTIAAVTPVASSNSMVSQQAETSAELEPIFSRARSFDEKDGNEAAISDTKDGLSISPSTPCARIRECRAIIEQIRREDFGIGLELGKEEAKLVQRQREREGRGLHRLSSELYARDTHFVLELVQNADDNSYPEVCCGPGFPSIVFVLERDKIVVLNNEVGFIEKNIRALCDVGRSTKGAHRYGYIGKKGIGFKSVFRVSDSPEIHSNGYHIRFDAKSGPTGYIVPEWIGDSCSEEPNDVHVKEGMKVMEKMGKDGEESNIGGNMNSWPTCIVLPLKDEHKGNEKSSLTAGLHDVHPSLLLFLHRLKGIFIYDEVNKSLLKMIRRDLGDNVMEVLHNKGTERWLVVKKQLEATKALPPQNVFAYLPLRNYGFRFIIQGDFEVPSSREDVDSDKSWNQWLREEIPQLFIDAMSVFMEHSSFCGLSSLVTYFQFVPLEEEILDFFTPVARLILTLLQGKSCIPVKSSCSETEQPNGGHSGKSFDLVLPSQAIVCEDSVIQELIPSTLLEEHLGLRYLHPEMVPALNPTLRSRLGIETLSSRHLIDIAKAEVKKTSKGASHGNDRKPDTVRIAWVAGWFRCMYRSLEQERNTSQEMLDLIGSLDMIPLMDGSFVNVKEDSIFLPLLRKKTSERAVPEKNKGFMHQEKTFLSVLAKDVTTVHPSLLSSLDDIGRSQVEELLRRLGVKMWTPKEVVNNHIIPVFKSKKWKCKSTEVLRSYLAYILEERLDDPSVCDMDELRSCVRILTNKGTLNPKSTPIHLTPKYGSTIDLARQLPSISWTIIDESYLDYCITSRVRTRDWKAFVDDLGLKQFLAIEKKQVKLHRKHMARSPWESYEQIWQITPDDLFIIDDWSCEEFEEFLSKTTSPDAKQLVSSDESTFLAQCIDERWDHTYAQFAEGSVQVKDINGHVLGETKSSFYLNLVSKPWVPSNVGGTNLYLPRDLFAKTDALYHLLEDHVNYVAADLKSPSLVSALGIRQSIGVDGMISEMRKWSDGCDKQTDGNRRKYFTTSFAHIIRVYSFLFEKMSQSDEERKKIFDAFLKNALIFVPRHDRHLKFPLSRPECKVAGSFLFKKEVCWEDPTDVSLKLFKEYGKVPTRRILKSFYACSGPKSHQSLESFFLDQIHVDVTPNVDEYIEMATTVADVAGFPTPSSLSDMLKIFRTLGSKCVSLSLNSSMQDEEEIHGNIATFVKKSLQGERKCIFPTSDKWVALSDQPLIADDQTMLKIFHKEKSIHFLDLGDSFQPQKRGSSTSALKPQFNRNTMEHFVSLFLKICEVKALSGCVKKELVPIGSVKYQCTSVQKYFHQNIPYMQRFLRSKYPSAYNKLKNEGFAEKLLHMQFASVQSVETVYSLTTHSNITRPLKVTSGLQESGITYCFFVVQEHQDSADVLNAEMAKLLLGGKKEGSSELINFLVAVKTHSGDNFEGFLEDVQGLEPLPEGEERWSVPLPEEPEKDESERSTTYEDVPFHEKTQAQSRSGNNGLRSWPPRSFRNYGKECKRKGESGSDPRLKIWPVPAPPESVDKPPKAARVPRKSEERDERKSKQERLATVTPIPQHTSKDYHQPAETMVEGAKVNESQLSAIEAVNDLFPSDKSLIHNVEHIEPPPLQMPMPGKKSAVTIPGDVTRHTSRGVRFWFDRGPSDFDDEDLPINDKMKSLHGIPLMKNPTNEEIGRWGEQYVFEFLREQARCEPSASVEIVWINEKGNTTAPYDIEIRRNGVRGGDDRHPVLTYVEVKTTSFDKKDIFELSVQELQFALAHQDAFHLYRVFNAGKPDSVRIRRLQNLAEHIERKAVRLCLVI